MVYLISVCFVHGETSCYCIYSYNFFFSQQTFGRYPIELNQFAKSYQGIGGHVGKFRASICKSDCWKGKCKPNAISLVVLRGNVFTSFEAIRMILRCAVM